MSWQDRPYAHEDSAEGPRRSYHGSGMEPLSVTALIFIANAVVFYLRYVPAIYIPVESLGQMQPEAVLHGQVWRLFTATYLHVNLTHILLNMLGLYFLGPALERVWGRRQFFLVYTLGGVAGNILFTAAGTIGWIESTTLGMGASGSILALLGAASVLFPDAEIYVYFLLPVRIRTFAIAYGAWFVYNIVHKGSNYGGDLCHLGGILLGYWWAESGGVSISGKHYTTSDPGSMAAKLKSLVRPSLTGSANRPFEASQEHADQETIDRILGKISEKGIDGLSPEEKAALGEATRRSRKRGGDSAPPSPSGSP
ncbi:MAG: rhomboid family intramembrane serine protease [Phycisphaerae bacterium]|nr:rhomboid family intramembrane serine protease [Phycisphaerae bacterium]